MAAASAILAGLVTSATVVGRQPRPTAGAGRAETAAAGTLATVSRGWEAPVAAGSPAVVVVSTTAMAQPPATGGSSGSVAAPLAGRIKPGVTYHAVATEYSAGDGDGACLFGPAANLMIAAMNYYDYETAKACGAYVRVSAANGASVTVLITNECPYPCARGQLDLSQQAFAKIADPKLGRIRVTWTLLSPGIKRTISIRYMTGSSRWWCGIQVIGHRNPVARLEVRVGSGWRRLPRTGYNYFISAHGSGCGGPIRVTDIYGQRLAINGIALVPNVVQPTTVQFARHSL